MPALGGPGRQTRPRELVKLEREVALSTETAFDAYYRLRPRCGASPPPGSPSAASISTRPRARRQSCSAPRPGTSSAPDRPRPRDHDAPGMPLDRIAAVVASVEQL